MRSDSPEATPPSARSGARPGGRDVQNHGYVEKPAQHWELHATQSKTAILARSSTLSHSTSVPREQPCTVLERVGRRGSGRGAQARRGKPWLQGWSGRKSQKGWQGSNTPGTCNPCVETELLLKPGLPCLPSYLAERNPSA